MKIKQLITSFVLLALSGGLVTAAPLGTAFTYQGRLEQDGGPATGWYDFLFRLYDAPSAGKQVGANVSTNGVLVNGGLFVVQLDFGSEAFTGEERWLQISVQTNGGSRLTLLSPRQALTPTPQAQVALTVPDGAISGAKLAPGAVQATHLQAGAVTSGHLAAGAVQGSNIVSGAIASVHLAAGAVRTSNIVAGAITSVELAPGAVAATHLAPGTAAANLAASGQRGVGLGGMVLSEDAENASLTASGYVKIGKVALSEGQWTRYADGPPATGRLNLARHGHSAVWTGTEMIIWGGRSSWTPYTEALYLNDGARYDPATDTWRLMSTNHALPPPEYSQALVWTGNRLIVGSDAYPAPVLASYNPGNDTWSALTSSNVPGIGGAKVLGCNNWLVVVGRNFVSSVGHRYNIVTDTWMSITTNGAPVRFDTSAVSIGAELLVWGGYTLVGSPWSPPLTVFLNDGFRYNPAADTWTPISTNGAPTARSGALVLWTGTEMIVWGGGDDQGQVLSGARYRPATDTWTPISSSGQPRWAGADHPVVWAGNRMVIWGPSRQLPTAPTNTGVCYDPGTDSWSATELYQAPVSRKSHTLVSTGPDVLVWGGTGPERRTAQFDVGGRYDVAGNTWTPLAPSLRSGELGERRGAAAVWTGTELIVWGGEAYGYRLGGGARFHPGSNTWTLLPTNGAPSARWGHSAVWANGEMLVWGGFGTQHLGDGARYSPALNRWLPLSLQDAPSPRQRHSAIWSGSEMIIWGGAQPNRVYSQSGRRYNPVTDQWQTVTTLEAPAGRSGHSATWTGTEMIVWGGVYLSASFPYPPVYLATGGRYHPGNNTWTPLPTTGAPSARANHSAGWTSSSELMIWGGEDGAPLNSGARFHTISDAWTPMSLVGAPGARSDAGTVWDGSHWVIFGGTDGTNALGSAAAYTPRTDTWEAWSFPGSPEPRMDYTSVWTGTEMLIWGGVTERDPETEYSSSLFGLGPPRTVYLYLNP